LLRLRLGVAAPDLAGGQDRHAARWRRAGVATMTISN
jgi:hypothetical protein